MDVLIKVFDVIPLTNAVPLALIVAVLTKVFDVIESVISVFAIKALFATVNPKPVPVKETFATETMSPKKLVFDETTTDPKTEVLATDRPTPEPDKIKVPAPFV